MSEEEFLRALEEEERNPPPPNGHAPMNSWTIPAEYYFFKDGDPRLEAAFAEYDREYFAAHPEDKEKYGYKG